jgi:hypothetical protein
MWTCVYYLVLFAFPFHQYPRAHAGKPLSLHLPVNGNSSDARSFCTRSGKKGGGSSGFQHMFQALQVCYYKLAFLV